MLLNRIESVTTLEQISKRKKKIEGFFLFSVVRTIFREYIEETTNFLEKRSAYSMAVSSSSSKDSIPFEILVEYLSKINIFGCYCSSSAGERDSINIGVRKPSDLGRGAET